MASILKKFLATGKTFGRLQPIHFARLWLTLVATEYWVEKWLQQIPDGMRLRLRDAFAVPDGLNHLRLATSVESCVISPPCCNSRAVGALESCVPCL